MSRRILAACAAPILALLLRSAPALAQGVVRPVTLPDLTGLAEVAPPPDSANPAGSLRADDPRVERFLAYFQGPARGRMASYLARSARSAAMIRQRFEAEVSVASLRRVNALPADYPLRPGMYLRIPG